jgi:hypothetical protein
MTATQHSQARRLLQPEHSGLLVKFIPIEQRRVLLQLLNGEEGPYFAKMMVDLAARIEAMPGPHEGIEGDDAIVHLKYFYGSATWWITEKDSSPDQLQAFGQANLFGGLDSAEWGYISIDEFLTDRNVQLDLHWTPRSFKEIRK